MIYFIKPRLIAEKYLSCIGLVKLQIVSNKSSVFNPGDWVFGVTNQYIQIRSNMIRRWCAVVSSHFPHSSFLSFSSISLSLCFIDNKQTLHISFQISHFIFCWLHLCAGVILNFLVLFLLEITKSMRKMSELCDVLCLQQLPIYYTVILSYYFYSICEFVNINAHAHIHTHIYTHYYSHLFIRKRHSIILLVRLLVLFEKRKTKQKLLKVVGIYNDN